MKTLKSYLTIIVFNFAGAAIHANAAAEHNRSESGVCFQQRSLACKGTQPTLTENGSSRTQLDLKHELVAEDGYSRAPQGKKTRSQASDGFDRASTGKQPDRIS